MGTEGTNGSTTAEAEGNGTNGLLPVREAGLKVKNEKGKRIGGNKRGSKVRRGQVKKNLHRNCKIYYANVRGLKSKVESIGEILCKVNPTIICLTETHLGQEEKVEMQGYKVFTSNRNRDGGGVLIGIKDALASVTVEVKSEIRNYESMWVKIDNGRVKYRIGVIYAPQETKQKIKDLEEMYNAIKDEVRKAEVQREKIMIMGDFNCKVGTKIPGNKEELPKGGKLLIKMCDELGLSIINADPRCKGTWTRIENEARSVIDYGIIRKSDEEGLKNMNIDEDKIFTPFSMGKQVKYTDHCAIMVEFNWRLVCMNNIKQRKIINCKKFKEETEKADLKEIALENIGLGEKYTKWQNRVKAIVEKCERKASGKSKQMIKCVRCLMGIKRQVKKLD